MLLDASFSCAYCGTNNPTSVDLSQGRRQQYVEDCQICCRPNVLVVEIDLTGEQPEAFLHAEPESD